MLRAVYINLKEINKLQTRIMKFVDQWAHEEKTPIPLKEIIEEMKRQGIKDFTTVNAINGLLNKGFIRRAVTISNTTSFVQLRRV